MTNPDDPAFANDPDNMLKAKSYGSGLTKREWFAGMALRGMCAWDAEVNDPREGKSQKIIVEGCIVLADALIAELNKKP